ncbi:uncharacterized protein LOC111368377 [Olea europaea var. sylvestris]|uniref:uncharacterized protein LOC111368377 n=1 Tax=Olea europaea var. sylvestris TaxID=158386 RepID=UPI000C1D5001|nr:uncharacterized protein LOC111368377 [Olea europaea var. sylvestris]
MSIRQLEVIPELTPSMEEEARGLVRDLGVLHTPDEEMSDPSLDRDWVSDRRSPPPRASPLPFASPPSRVWSLPLASPPSRASPPPGPSPSPSASPLSRHLPRVSSGHSDDLYARLTGFIAEESSVVDFKDTVAVLRGDLDGRRWGDRGDGRDHDREGGRDGGGLDGRGGGGGDEGGGLDGRDGGGGPDGRDGGGGPGGREDARRD